MTNEEILGEVEKITLAMCDDAHKEAWERVAENEARRRLVLNSLATVTQQDLDTLKRIAEQNSQLIDRIYRRRDDIAKLLSAFGDKPLTLSK